MRSIRFSTCFSECSTQVSSASSRGRFNPTGSRAPVPLGGASTTGHSAAWVLFNVVSKWRWQTGRVHARLLIAFSLLIVVGTSGCSSRPSPSAADGGTHPPTIAPGATLPARWWTWTESMPPSKNPIDDPDGAECARNQPKDLWFLAGTHGGTATRTCRLPSGTSIY